MESSGVENITVKTEPDACAENIVVANEKETESSAAGEKGCPDDATVNDTNNLDLCDKNDTNNLDLCDKEDYYIKPENFDSQVHELIFDPDFISIRHRANEVSLFTILGRTYTEMCHSSFIAWLLNPDSEHGLGYTPMKHLLTAMRKKADPVNYQEALTHLPDQELIDGGFFDECVIMPDCHKEELAKEKDIRDSSNNEKENTEEENTEEENSKNSNNRSGRLDIAATMIIKPHVEGDLHELIFVCENKIKASERDDQTGDYAKWAYGEKWEKNDVAKLPLNGSKDFKMMEQTKNAHAALLFLTPDGGEPKDKRFIPLSYADLMNEVLIPCLYDPSITDLGKKWLSEYMQNLDICGYAVSDVLRGFAGKVLTKKSKVGKTLKQTILALWKLKDYHSKKENLNSPAARVQWLLTYCKGFAFGENTKIQWRRKTQNAVTEFLCKDKACIKEKLKNSKDQSDIYILYEDQWHDLKPFWDNYTNKVYPENASKLSYAVSICEKYKTSFEMLFSASEDQDPVFNELGENLFGEKQRTRSANNPPKTIVWDDETETPCENWKAVLQAFANESGLTADKFRQKAFANESGLTADKFPQNESVKGGNEINESRKSGNQIDVIDSKGGVRKITVSFTGKDQICNYIKGIQEKEECKKEIKKKIKKITTKNGSEILFKEDCSCKQEESSEEPETERIEDASAEQ